MPIHHSRLLLLAQIPSLLLAFSSPLHAQRTTPPSSAEERGLPETLPLAPLSNCQWLSGTPVSEFEPEALYLIECWATVSEPSVSRIPYLNDLDARFSAAGLHVIGVAVGEANLNLVERFVSTHEPAFNYPVAFAGAAGPFLTQWVAACGVTTVPHAFLLRDGQLLLSAPADKIHDAMIAGILNGSISHENLQREIENRVEGDSELAAAAQAFDRADAQRDVAAMRTALAGLENLGVRELILERCRCLIALQSGATEEALDMIDDAAIRAQQQQLMYLFQYSIGLTVRTHPLRVNEAIWRKLESVVTEHLEGAANHLELLEALCRLRWDLGDREGAVEIAQRMEQAAKVQDQFPWAYSRFASEVESGTLPTRAELTRRFSTEADVR